MEEEGKGEEEETRVKMETRPTTQEEEEDEKEIVARRRKKDLAETAATHAAGALSHSIITRTFEFYSGRRKKEEEHNLA